MHKFLARGLSVDWRVSGGASCSWAMFYVGSCQSLKCYSVDDRRINMEQLWNYNDRGKTEALGDNLPYCYFVHHKSCMDWSGIEPGPLRWQAGNWRCLEVLWCPTKVDIALRKWIREETIRSENWGGFLNLRHPARCYVGGCPNLCAGGT